MTFEPIEHEPDDYELDDEPGPRAAGERLSIGERFKRYMAGRRDAGLGHRDPDTPETERLWSAVATTPDPETAREINRSRPPVDSWIDEAPITDRQLDVLRAELDNRRVAQFNKAVVRKLVHSVELARAAGTEQPQDDDVQAARVWLAELSENIRSYHQSIPGQSGCTCGRSLACGNDVPDYAAIWTLEAALDAWVPGEEAEQPQDERDARIAELERELRDLRGTELNPSPLMLDAQAYGDLRDVLAAAMGDGWDLDEAEISILIKYVRWLAAGQPRDEDGYPIRRETYPPADAKAARDKWDGDVRAVAWVLRVYGTSPGEPFAMTRLRTRFADRIAALDAKAGEQR